MVAGLGPGPPAREHTVLGHKLPATTGRRCETRERRFNMQWTTPTATDLRFGFEITLYVAAR